MLYFAYGSNMNWEQVKRRCPSATFVSIAKLKDYRFAIARTSYSRGCGSAGVLPAPGAHVWGVVYDIEGKDFGPLDQAEDFVPGREKNSYTRQQCLVYPVPQNAPHASAGMNPVRSQLNPRAQSYGVNVLNFPEGQRPNPVPHSLKVSRAKPPEPTTWYGTKATDVSPWYGVYADSDEGKAFAVSIYFPLVEENPPLPNAEYKRLIVSGAEHWQLPRDYIRELEKMGVSGDGKDF